VRERLMAQGMTDASMKPAEFAAAIRDETAVWAKIIKARNIVAE
jgi:tripartite-type tricarboxylate transporter receptor subunit TctC